MGYHAGRQRAIARGMARGAGADREIADHGHIADRLEGHQGARQGAMVAVAAGKRVHSDIATQDDAPIERIERQIGMGLGLVCDIFAPEGHGRHENVARNADAVLLDVGERIRRGAVTTLATGQGKHVSPPLPIVRWVAALFWTSTAEALAAPP